MNEFTYNEMVELRKYINHQLLNMNHVIIDIDITNDLVFVYFKILYNYDFVSTYQINIQKDQDLYQLAYMEYDYLSLFERPRRMEQLYEIEDFNDVLNVLEDIFDNIRPRDEY